MHLARAGVWFVCAVVLIVAGGMGSAQAQWQARPLADSPFVVTGPAFKDARGMVRESMDAKSIRHWEAMFRRGRDSTLLVYVESLGHVAFDKEPARQRLERSGLDAQSFPNLKWGDGGKFTTGLGQWDYFHFTWSAQNALQSCVGFITVVDRLAAGDKRGLHGAHCIPGTERIAVPVIEDVLKGVGIKGFHVPAG